MQKVDSSVLGFTVIADPQRTNAGELDKIWTPLTLHSTDRTEQDVIRTMSGGVWPRHAVLTRVELILNKSYWLGVGLGVNHPSLLMVSDWAAVPTLCQCLCVPNAMSGVPTVTWYTVSWCNIKCFECTRCMVVSVCLLAYLKNHKLKLHQIFNLRLVWLWLGSSVET